MRQLAYSRSRQSGAVLFIAIVLLLVMTLIGATAMKMTTSQERQAGIIQDIEVAFQETEANLRDGEAEVRSQPVAPIATATPVDSLSGGVYTPGPNIGTIANPILYHEWPNQRHDRFHSAATGTGTAPNADDPVFIVEEIAIISDVLNLGDPPAQIRHFYRITASGTGEDDATHALLQSTFAEVF